jgi:hypothetical protein
MTIQNWNPNDWKVYFEDIYFEGEIINAPVIWKIGKVTEYILENIVPDAKKALANGGELSSLLLALALIDYIAGYFVGKGTGERAYIDYMKRYFPPKYHPYLHSIYGQLRCGLLHNLVAYNPHYKGEHLNYIISGVSKDHLERKEISQLIFSIPIFIEDTRRAYIMYSYDLVMKPKDNPDLIANFNDRYNKLNGQSSVMVKIPD